MSPSARNPDEERARKRDRALTALRATDAGAAALAPGFGMGPGSRASPLAGVTTEGVASGRRNTTDCHPGLEPGSMSRPARKPDEERARKRDRALTALRATDAGAAALVLGFDMGPGSRAPPLAGVTTEEVATDGATPQTVSRP